MNCALRVKALTTVGNRTIGVLIKLCSNDDDLQDVLNEVKGKGLKDLSYARIEELRRHMVIMTEETMVDYFEQVIDLKKLNKILRVTRGLYDLSQVLSEMRDYERAP